MEGGFADTLVFRATLLTYRNATAEISVVEATMRAVDRHSGNGKLTQALRVQDAPPCPTRLPTPSTRAERGCVSGAAKHDL